MIKSVMGPLFFAMLFGFLLGKFVYYIYSDDIVSELRSSKIYLIQNGEYSSYDDMREGNISNSYVYYKDNDKYKSVVGITKNEDNVDKIKNLYNDELVVSEYYVSTDLINDKQNYYDSELAKADNLKEVTNILSDILDLYKEDEAIRLFFLEQSFINVKNMLKLFRGEDDDLFRLFCNYSC